MDRIYEGEYKITSPFGERDLPNGDDRFHYGEDHVGINNKTIVSPTSGKVVSSWRITDKSNPTWELGNYVKIDDLNGYYLFFCHLSMRLVKVGDRVEEGQPLGIEGATGYTDGGTHCHFEVRRKSDGLRINPRDYFKILSDWEEKHYREKTQERFGFDESTMKFFDNHPYPHSLFKKLATMK